MNIKKIAIILVVAAASFGVMFSLSRRKEQAKQHAPVAAAPAASEPVQAAVEPEPVGVDLSTLRPNERQMEELRKEYRQKLESCRKKEEELATLAKRVQLEQEMLKKQAQDMENLQMQLVAPLTRLKEAQAELQKSRVVVAAQEKANLKRTATIYASMDASAGGKILADMVQNNHEDDAAKILFYMQERSAAKLLAEIPDRGAAAKLCDRLKVIKEES